MKRTFLLLLLFFPLAYANAQERVFLRVYNAQGKKISKGHLFYLCDTSITLTRKTNIVTETPVSQIHLIKSKRTTANRILVTTATVAGIAAIAIAFVATVGNDGGGRHLFHPRVGRNRRDNIHPLPRPKPFKRYEVDGDAQNWQQQKARLVLLF